MQDPVVIALLGGMAGIIVSMIGFWAKGQVERIGAVENRADAHNSVQVERVIDHTGDIARLQAQVEALVNSSREDRAGCTDLRERTARLEAFQAWAEPLLEKAVAGLEAANAFQARFDERLVTLFKGLGAATQRLERLQSAMAG